VKQTYSVYLNESEGNKRKWHLSTSLSPPFPNPCLICLAAYFTQATVDSLGTVDDIPVLKDLVVPEGLFRSSRRTKTRSSRANAAAHAADASPAIPAPASSSGKSGKQIASVAGPSSTVSRTPPQVMTQSVASQQNQALPPTSAYPRELFNPKSPPYSGLPTNSAPPPTPVQQPDAYARIYTGESYTSPQPPEGYHVSPSPHMQPHVTPFEYNWPAPPTPVADNACPSGYPYPGLVDSQKGDSSFQHSPVQSQLYVYGSGFQASLQYRTVSPALSHAPSQFSASSQSQSSSESDSPAPGPVPLRTPVFSPDRLSVVLPTDGETKYEIHGIRDPDSTIDSKVGLVSMESLNRYHPYRREPLDDRVVQRFLRPF
jgi:Gti1/Pac2 family transcription factor